MAYLDAFRDPAYAGGVDEKTIGFAFFNDLGVASDNLHAGFLGCTLHGLDHLFEDLNRQVLTLSAQVADQTEREFIVGPSKVNREVSGLGSIKALGDEVRAMAARTHCGLISGCPIRCLTWPPPVGHLRGDAGNSRGWSTPTAPTWPRSRC